MALAVRGERGSQPCARGGGSRSTRDGARRSRRARIATRWRSGTPRTCGRMALAVRGERGSQPLRRRPAVLRPPRMALAVRGERGSQLGVQRADWRHGEHGARRSRRARIATFVGSGTAWERLTMALAVRGERGSQRFLDGRSGQRDQRWRSPFAASEDRNCRCTCASSNPKRWRSPFAASEDRNAVWSGGDAGAQGMALAVRGERGSQPRCRPGDAAGVLPWRSPFAASEDRNSHALVIDVGTEDGARRSRRARIATGW